MNFQQQSESFIEFNRRIATSRRIRPDGTRAAAPPPLLLVGPDPASGEAWTNECSRPSVGILIGLAITTIVGVVWGVVF